jgi:predicted transport protein
MIKLMIYTSSSNTQFMPKLNILKSVELDVSEKELQELFEKNLESVEDGLKHVGSYVHIGTGTIDVLAIDEENNPVIIELKRMGDFDKDALIQLMEYYSWFSRDRNHIRLLFSVFEKKGYKDVSQEIRLMALVSSVSDEVKNACWALKPAIKLVSYTLSKSSKDEEIFVVPIVALDTSVGASSFVYQPKSEDDHFKTNPHMKPLYEKLKKECLSIDKTIKINPSPQDYIGFVGKKNFCGIHVMKSWLRLDFPLTFEEANNPEYTWNENWGEWGYYRLDNEEKLEKALELIKKAFAKSL